MREQAREIYIGNDKYELNPNAATSTAQTPLNAVVLNELISDFHDIQ